MWNISQIARQKGPEALGLDTRSRRQTMLILTIQLFMLVSKRLHSYLSNFGVKGLSRSLARAWEILTWWYWSPPPFWGTRMLTRHNKSDTCQSCASCGWSQVCSCAGALFWLGLNMNTSSALVSLFALFLMTSLNSCKASECVHTSLLLFHSGPSILRRFDHHSCAP